MQRRAVGVLAERPRVRGAAHEQPFALLLAADWHCPSTSSDCGGAGGRLQRCVPLACVTRMARASGLRACTPHTAQRPPLAAACPCGGCTELQAYMTTGTPCRHTRVHCPPLSSSAALSPLGPPGQHLPRLLLLPRRLGCDLPPAAGLVVLPVLCCTVSVAVPAGAPAQGLRQHGIGAAQLLAVGQPAFKVASCTLHAQQHTWRSCRPCSA